MSYANTRGRYVPAPPIVTITTQETQQVKQDYSFWAYLDDAASASPPPLVIATALLLMMSCAAVIVITFYLVYVAFGQTGIWIAIAVPFPIISVTLWRRYRRWLARKVAEEL